MPVKAGYLLLAAGGGLFLWSGTKNKSVTSAIRAVIGGESPATASTLPGGGSTTTAATAGDTGASTKTAAQNQALARALALTMGYPSWVAGQQWSDWVSLWNQESGWSATARNASSGAYGIPQALPPTKMPAGAQAPASNPVLQIIWGIQYIAGRYGSPSVAWAHEQSNNWY